MVSIFSSFGISAETDFNDPMLAFCLTTQDAGKEVDECLDLAGIYSSLENPETGAPNEFVTTLKTQRQNYQRLISSIQSNNNSDSIDTFKNPSKTFEFVETCGVYFSSGEHPVYVRCKITDTCTGAFDPDVVLSVNWDRLIWDPLNTVVEHGNPVTCAVSLDLNQLPEEPASCAQQIVDEFNQSPSCNASGLSAVFTDAPAATFIDIYFTPQAAQEMSMPGPLSAGMLTR